MILKKSNEDRGLIKHELDVEWNNFEINSGKEQQVRNTKTEIKLQIR